MVACLITQTENATSSLDTLNDDILEEILSIMPFSDLACLSTVSHRLRCACKPLIFRTLTFTSLRNCDKHFLPRSFWRYIRIASICWIPQIYPESRRLELESSFPQLHSLHTICIEEFDHCISWSTLKALLSPPALQNLEVLSYRWPARSPFDIEELKSMQLSLRKFKSSTCGSFWSYPVNRDLIPLEAAWTWWILEKSRLTLESLTIPAETAQYSRMIATTWPSLQEFNLYGFAPDPDVSLLSFLSRTQKLRSLTLKLAQTREYPPFMLWPPGAVANVDLTHLRSFTISYPHPDDTIFSHLPSELQSLSVRDCPRYYIGDTVGEIPKRMPLLSATELLRILRTQVFHHLERLEVVYRADGNDSELVEFIVTTFPLLTFLEIHRYPAHGDETIPLTEIIATLSRLTHLRVLHLNLTSPASPPSPLDGPLRESTQLQEAQSKLVAQAFSRSQLREMGFLNRQYSLNFWATWYIDRDSSGHITQCYHEELSTLRYRFVDEPGPPVRPLPLVIPVDMIQFSSTFIV
ncbi:hypothetical protein A0H81_12504 [Grifola frondosa]|uniref:F-box domain-containing protein n=1 Tax=Grifola frondosa TaxID=5627 RepID=A0A1C7LSG0_GRIFR|nr:hypothetical protein A0H81_12504 [Grifola frondosa]